MLVIDPPSGWMYGFPKPYDNPEGEDVNIWLAMNGYPIDQITLWTMAGRDVPCRFWNHEDV